MYDVLLFSGVGRQSFDIKPLGMYKIASVLRTKGYRVKTINNLNLITFENFKTIVDNYISDNTKLIGISATVLKNYITNNFFGLTNTELEERINYIKNKNTSIKFVLGGSQVSNTTLNLLEKFSFLDYLIKGQGEESIINLMDSLISKKPILTNTLSKPFLITEQSYPYHDFKQSPHVFHEDDNIQQHECLPLEIARGCIFKCKFCSYDLTNKEFDEFTRQETLIRDEMLYNYEKFKTTNYLIVDDLINDSEEKVDMLLRITESLPFKVILGGYHRLDLIWRFPSMITKLKKMGIKSVFFGIETTNDLSGKMVGKGLGLQRINETLDLLHKEWGNEIHIAVSVILGLPKDTPESIAHMRNWIIEKLKNNIVHAVYVAPLSIHPQLGKAEIDKDPEKFGYKITDLETTTRHRYGMPPANWTTEFYSYEQAVKDCEDIYMDMYELSTREVHTFNVPHILSYNDEIINRIYTKMLQENGNYQKLVKYLSYKHQKQQENYLNMLLDGK